MKTLLKKLKLFSGLTLVLLVLGSGLLPTPTSVRTVLTPAASAACDAGTYNLGGECLRGYAVCPDGVSPIPGKYCDPVNHYCPSGTTYVQAYPRPCLDPGSAVTGPVGTPNPETGTREPCVNTTAPVGTDCTKIPMGCPGSQIAGPIARSTPITCQFTPSATSGWTCPVDRCEFNNGQYMEYGQKTLTTPHPEGADDSSTGCDLGGNPFTWFICPAIGILEETIRKVDSYIMQYLTFNTDEVFGKDGNTGSGSSKGYYTAWNSFRILATAILVIGGLVMIVAQALGLEILDAYTTKKVLPRILIATIGISLSWPLMRFAIDFINVVGLDIRNLIYSPFSYLPPGTLGGSTLFVANGGVILALFFLGPGAIFSFFLTAALAVLVGFIIIIVRNMALIVLIVLAPIGIASFILPNTEKIWKLWKDNFIGLLLVFPIISAFIAIGRVFSAVSLSSPGTVDGTTGAGTIAQIVGFVAYFLPYFLLPIAFRLATGVIGAVAGFVNNQNRGAFDRLKKYRGNQIAKNSAAMSAGTRTNNRAINALTSRASTKGRGFGNKGRAAYNQKMDLAAMNDAKGAGMAIQHNDDALRAATYGSAIEARSKMKEDWLDSEGNQYTDQQVDAAIGAVKASGGFGRGRQVYAAQQLSTTGTGYGKGNIEQVAQTIARVSHGNESQISSLAGNINAGTKSAGRHDLAPGFGKLDALAKMEASGTVDRQSAQYKAQYGDARESAWNSGSLYQHANDKKANIQSAIQHHQTLLRSTDKGQREKAAVFFNEIKSMQPNASGDVKIEIQKALEGNRDDIDNLFKDDHPMALAASPAGIEDKRVGREEVQVIEMSAPAAPTRVSGGSGPRVAGTQRQRGPAPPATISGTATKTYTEGTVVPESAKQRVERQSRTYERPDPNTLT